MEIVFQDGLWDKDDVDELQAMIGQYGNLECMQL